MTRSWFPCLLVLLATPPAIAQTPKEDPIADLSADDLARGRRLFEGQCARCHGFAGTGGTGPNLNRPTLRHAADDQQLFNVIKNGIPGTGMPLTWQMSDREIWQVAGYLRSLGRIVVESLSGDPENGRAIYETKGGCAACHVVAGAGGSLGPELTDVGGRRGADYLRESLIDPGAALPEGLLPFYSGGYAEYLTVTVVTRDGESVRGMRVNEDAFTIQLRDADNRFHSFQKLELRDLKKEFGQSLMPSYKGTLSDSEIDDLVAYLASLGGER